MVLLGATESTLSNMLPFHCKGLRPSNLCAEVLQALATAGSPGGLIGT